MNRSSAKPVHCVIFGASSAIAAACGEIWARRQASLVLVGRSADKLERLKAHLQVCGASVVQVICQDLGDMTKHQSLVAELTAAGQTLDVVLLAHGTLGNQETAAVHAAAMLDIMRDNALSQMSLITHLTPILERQGRGALGVITSVAGDRGRPSNYVYGAAKGAVSIFLSGLRGRLYQRGVAVVDIRPGFVATPMTAHLKQGALFVRPEGVARGIVKAMDFGCSVVYLPWFWRYIMLIIKHIPVFLFKRIGNF